MKEAKLRELERQLIAWRRSPHGVDAKKVVGLALKLGRVRFDKGKEPTYVSKEFLNLRPVSIPLHRASLAPGTLRNIIDSLLIDVEEWQNCLNNRLGNDEADD